MQENHNEESEDDDEDLPEADEEDSDLDLAWKMLDVARAIVEKQPGDTLEKVDILETLAEVSLERGLFFTLCIFQLLLQVIFWLNHECKCH